MNIHTKKLNCRRCKANSSIVMERAEDICDLGYSYKINSWDEFGFDCYGIPQEKCPKPLSWKDFLFAQKNYRKDQLCV